MTENYLNIVLKMTKNVQFFAASISGDKMDVTEELDASSSENNGVASNLNHMKRWFLSHAQYLKHSSFTKFES